MGGGGWVLRWYAQASSFAGQKWLSASAPGAPKDASVTTALPWKDALPGETEILFKCRQTDGDEMWFVTNWLAPILDNVAGKCDTSAKITALSPNWVSGRGCDKVGDKVTWSEVYFYSGDGPQTSLSCDDICATTLGEWGGPNRPVWVVDYLNCGNEGQIPMGDTKARWWLLTR
ncbi:MAG: hypothetical protein HY744_05520 [Deltaproteobacteria bacterium]|nr:hypothetical protein [Deltaproteobacteria bacterium]